MTGNFLNWYLLGIKIQFRHAIKRDSGAFYLGCLSNIFVEHFRYFYMGVTPPPRALK